MLSLVFHKSKSNVKTNCNKKLRYFTLKLINVYFGSRSKKPILLIMKIEIFKMCKVYKVGLPSIQTPDLLITESSAMEFHFSQVTETPDKSWISLTSSQEHVVYAFKCEEVCIRGMGVFLFSVLEEGQFSWKYKWSRISTTFIILLSKFLTMPEFWNWSICAY